VDRAEINRALAKYLAFRNVGKHDKAVEWARILVELLDLPSEALEDQRR